MTTALSHHRLDRLIPDLLRSRELLLNLVAKDFRVRYRYAFMGFLWAVIEPLLMCLILTFVFSFVFELRNLDASIDSPLDFALLLLCALVPWQFFSHAVATATNSLIDHRELVAKAAFPREVVPLSAVGIAMVNFAFAFVVLLVLLTVLGHFPGLTIFWILPIFAVQLALVVGFSILLAPLNVRFRDIKYMVEVGLVFLFYATPIFYMLPWVQQRAETMPAWVLPVYMLNPMVGVVTAYREVLFHHRTPSLELLIWPLCLALIILAVGAYVFRRMSGTLSDHL